MVKNDLICIMFFKYFYAFLDDQQNIQHLIMAIVFAALVLHHKWYDTAAQIINYHNRMNNFSFCYIFFCVVLYVRLIAAATTNLVLCA